MQASLSNGSNQVVSERHNSARTSSSNNVILHLSPAPLSPPRRPARTAAVEKAVRSNSGKAQYFNLTMDQIRKLAETKEVSEQTVVEETESQCCLNGKKEEARKFNTLPRRRKNVLPSPDIVKEVELKKDKRSALLKTDKSSKVSRSKSFNVKRSGEAVGAKREETSKPGEGVEVTGGLFAPTKSWLNYLNDRRGLKARQERSSRSNSLPRKGVERAGSLHRKVRVEKEDKKSSESVQSIEKRNTESNKTNGKKTTELNKSNEKKTTDSIKSNDKKIIESIKSQENKKMESNKSLEKKTTEAFRSRDNKIKDSIKSNEKKNGERKTKDTVKSVEKKTMESVKSAETTNGKKESAKKSLAVDGKSVKDVHAVNGFDKNLSHQVSGNKISNSSTLKRQAKKSVRENSEARRKVTDLTKQTTSQVEEVKEADKSLEESQEERVEAKQEDTQIIDSTSESATQVIKKFESKISQVSETKTSVKAVDVKNQQDSSDSKSQSLKLSKMKKSDARIIKKDSSTKAALKGTAANPSHSECNATSANGEVILTRQDGNNSTGYGLYALT